MGNYNTNFLYEIGQKINTEKAHLQITGRFRKNGHKKYTYKCLKCTYEGQKDEWGFRGKTGCPCCANQIVVKGINDITTTDPWMIDFFVGGAEEAAQYTKSSGLHIKPKCPYCGRVKENTISLNNLYKTRKVSCVCRDGMTIPNKFIYALMEQLYEQQKIQYFQSEYKIENRKFDMYFIIGEQQYLIEMDGGKGHGYIIAKHPLGNNKFRAVSAKMFLNDAYKDSLAQKSNIPLIRIDCYYSDLEYIKTNILQSKLVEIVDIKNIDWERLAKTCCSNLKYEVCKYKKENPEVFANECAEKFGLSRTTIYEYWKEGTTYGWCYYDARGETKRSMNTKQYYYNAKPIIVENLNTNEKMWFKSTAELCRRSKEVIGKVVTRKKIIELFRNASVITTYDGFKIYRKEKGEY